MQVILFFIGLLCAFWVPKIIWIFAPIFLIGFFYRRYFILLLSLCCLLGYFWGAGNNVYRQYHAFPKTLENNILLANGYIASIPECQKEYCQFEFSLEKIINSTQQWQGRALISWYYPPKKMTLKPGQRWQFYVKLKKPRGYHNPGSFDYEAWLFEKNITAKGYVYDKPPAFQSKLFNHTRWVIVEQMRQWFLEQWQPFSKAMPFLDILLALTIGTTQGITSAQWQVFTNTGTIHLISISGFHITLIAGMIYGLINAIWRRIYYVCQRFPAQRAGAVGALIGALIYALLAGFSIPTQRSLIMVCVFMMGILWQRQTDVWQCFRWSLLAVLLWDPFAPLNMGFWLSFSSVAVIFYVMLENPSYAPFSKRGGVCFKIILWLKIQGFIFLGIIPFSLFWFGQVAISSLWANFVAISVTGFFVLPLALLAILIGCVYFPAAMLLMKFSHWGFAWLFVYLSWISEHHPLLWVWSIDNAWVLSFSVMGLILLLMPKGFPGRSLSVLFFLPLFFPITQTIPYGEAQLSLLDVGQGLASVVQTQNHVLIFDTGPKFNDTADTGKMVVLPFLKSQHIRSIDALIISHADNDHRGGMASILAAMPVKQVFVNDKKILKTAQLCVDNIAWEWDGVQFQFLTRGLSAFTNTNDRSCVLKISNPYHSLLMPGDLEKRGEIVLIQEYGKNALKSDVLIAGHHGSKTSSSQDWIQAVSSQYVLFSAGYLNRYHFPHPDVVARYQKNAVKGLSTIDCGMIGWRITHHQEMALPLCTLLP